MKYCPLFSGSGGNCTYIASPEGAILVDVGVSARRAEQALRRRDIDPHSVAAIVVTHEHSDHIAGVRVFAQRYGCAVVGSPGTLAVLRRMDGFRDVSLVPMQPGGDARDWGTLSVSLFPTPHDCAQSAGVVVRFPDGRKIAVATDMGEITDEIRAALSGCELLHIEANHDVDMLTRGGYPVQLKRRILGREGHLSNAACAAELVSLVRAGATRIVLAHLSRENNTPALAYETVRGTLEHAGLRERQAYLLTVALQEDVHPVLTF